MHHVLHKVLGDALHERAKHLETFALPFGERILLPHRTQVDALLQVVHFFEMFTPALVNDAQHHLAFNFAHRDFAKLCFTRHVIRRRIGHHEVVHLVGVATNCQLLSGQAVWPERSEFGDQTRHIPLVVGFRNTMGFNE